MGTRRVVIWGAGGHALVVADIVRRVGWYDLIGFLDDVNPERHRDGFGDSIILGGREQLDILKARGIQNIIIGVGNNEARMRLARDADDAGFWLAAAIHPRATVPRGFQMGRGTVIMAGAVVNPGTIISENIIINTGATVDHDCVIAAGAHICPGVHLASRVIVEEKAWVGIGATVISGIRIGAGAIIGAGAVVLRDVTNGTVCYGNPARFVRPVRKGDFARLV